MLVLYVGSYLARPGAGAVRGSVPGSLLLGTPPEVLEEKNHQLHLWDCKLNELNVVCKHGVGNEPTVICVFQGTACIFWVVVQCLILFYTCCFTCSLGLCLCIKFQMSSSSQKGVSCHFQWAMGLDFHVDSVPGHNFQAWALLKILPGILKPMWDISFLKDLLQRITSGFLSFDSATSFFLLKTGEEFPWEPQNTKQKSSILPICVLKLLLHSQSVLELCCTISPTSRLRNLMMLVQS